MSGMTVADVMTHGAVSVTTETPYRELVDLVELRAVNAIPVVDPFSRVLGVVTASDLLHKIEFAGGVDPPRILESRRHRQNRRKAAGTVAGELMTAPAVTVFHGMSVVDAARLMETAGVRRLPVIDDLGRLVGMVTNRDLLKVFLRAVTRASRTASAATVCACSRAAVSRLVPATSSAASQGGR